MAASIPPTPIASMPSEPAAHVCESDPAIVAPGLPNRCMCTGCETPLPALENHSPNRWQADRRNRWSAMLSSSVCSRLWSTYWAETSVRTLSRPSASSSSMTMVPVASWVSVWSIRSPISSPGVMSPQTRCEEMSFCVTVRAMVRTLQPWAGLRGWQAGRLLRGSGRSAAFSPDKRGGRGADRGGVDTRGGELFRGGRRRGHGAHRQLPDRRYWQAAGGEGVEHGVAEPALRPVVLRGDDVARLVCRLAQRDRVDGLDRVRVDDPCRDAFGLQPLRGGQRLVHGDARRHDRDLVTWRGAQCPAAADGEVLAGPVDDRGAATGGPQVADPLAIGHRGGEASRLVRVAGIQHGAAVCGAERREVFQRHLRGAVLADGHTRVRAHHPQAGPADRGHADEVAGAGEEGSEGGGVRLPAPCLHAHRGGEHLLLGDVALEETFRVGAGEVSGPRRVAHLAVEHDDVGPGLADGRQRLAERGACRLLAAHLVGRQAELARAEPVRALAVRGPRHVHADGARAAELGDRRAGVGQRLAVKALLV